MILSHPRRILPLLAASGLALASCGGGGSTPAPTLQSIAVTPGSPTAVVGADEQLHATGTYSDGTQKDLTASATWTSSLAAVATVTSGLVTGVAAGAATISASDGGVSGTDTISILDTWVAAASSPILLSAQTATLLHDGTVLVDGGDPYQAGAAVYDPAADSWSATSAPETARYGATATLLTDGRVLVAGGSVLDTSAPAGSSQTIFLSSAELYDPTTKMWSAAADMPTPRQLHAAVLLQSGLVLIVGGDDGHQGLPDALVYDPAANTWTSSPIMITPFDLPTATVLASGKVLVTANLSSGASSPAYSEIYDSGTGAWSYGPAMNNLHLLGATATLLSDGRVLVAGGQTAIQPGMPMSVPEVYDPVANTWALAGSMAQGRVAHTATLLANGKVLVAGGYNSSNAGFSSTELYDPATNTWSSSASMATARDHHGAVLLPQGSVFVTGGQDQGAALQTSELFR
jgi:Galactose oxidase, central domain/Bacterial Ig-like domain (group 2)/Kelch motif